MWELTHSMRTNRLTTCSLFSLCNFSHFLSCLILGNPVELGHIAKPYSKRSTSNLVLIGIFVLLLCGAYILGAISISKYQNLSNDVSKMNKLEEISNNIVEEEIARESTTSNESDSSTFWHNLSCEDDPCENNGTCVTVIHAGYYCICNSERFYGRHCENGNDKDYSLFICFSSGKCYHKVSEHYVHTG